MVSQFTSYEAATFWRYIASSLDRLVTLALDIGDGWRWEPPAPETNSVAALAFHTLGNAEENILQTLCGQPVNRDRDGEFASRHRSQEELQERWNALRPQLEQALEALLATALDEPRVHPRRGSITGREVLIVVARHAAEHLGQADARSVAGCEQKRLACCAAQVRCSQLAPGQGYAGNAAGSR